jgi:hypothetical protein
MARRSIRRIARSPGLWPGCALLVPLTLTTVSVLGGLPAVVASGMCPPAPPDIPAVPCTAQQYLARMTVGFWALAGHLTLFCSWLAITCAAWLAARLVFGPDADNQRDPGRTRSLPQPGGTNE